MSRQVVIDLATRHQLVAVELSEVLEEWTERAAIREYAGGMSRGSAELAAVHDIEARFELGLRCPFTRQQMQHGGDRARPPRRALCARSAPEGRQ